MPNSSTYPVRDATPHLRLVDERAVYDAGVSRPGGHYTSVNDDVVDAILERLSPEALGIYVYLERRVNEAAQWSGSYSRMLDDIHIRKQTLIYQLQNLAREGFITITSDPNARQSHIPNTYTLPHHRRKAGPQASTEASSHSDMASTEASTEAGQSGTHSSRDSKTVESNSPLYPPTPKRGPTDPPDMFTVSAELRFKALGYGVPDHAIQTEVDKCLDYYRAKGKRMIDWEATVRNWLRNAPKMSGYQQASAHTKGHVG